MNKKDPSAITKAPLTAKTERTGSTEALSIYLNNQADVLHAYLVHFGKVEEVAQDPRILDFDDHGFDLDYTLPESDEPEENRRARITFDEPITRWSELRPMMLKMRDEATAALSIPKNPEIPSFVKPELFPELFVILVLFLFQAMFAIGSSTSPVPVLRRLAELRSNYLPGGMTTIKASYAFLLVAHVVEAVWYYFYLKREASVRRQDLSKWIYWTLAFGLVTMWPNYQRSLQRARVAGIYERIESAKAKGSKKAEGKKKR